MAKDDVKNVSVVEEHERDFGGHQPSKKEQEVVSSVFSKFRDTTDHRNQSFELLDNHTITEYIEDSVLRFITNVDEREDIEDWQARVNDPFTRNKVLAVLGQVVAALPIAEIRGRGDEDIRRSQILSNLYEYSEELDEYEEFMVHYLLEAIVKGTAIGFEGHQKKKVTHRDLEKLQNGEYSIKEREEILNRLFAEIVPLEDFYPSSVGIRKIKDMPYCFWRSRIPYQKFLQDFADFERATLVEPHSEAIDSEDEEDIPFYKDYLSGDVEDGHVEVIRYYNQDVDEFVILANGIWLNPINVSGENEPVEEISPLPYQHKDLPFFDVKFELLGDFFYGKSMGDKLKSLQDVLNVLTNMMLDQSFLSIFKPILTAGFDSIEDDYLRPGRRTPVDTSGLALQDSYQILDMGTPTGWHQFILEYTRKIMEEASVDQVTQGVAGVGGRTTAQEIRAASEGVAAMLGLFARLINNAIKRKATLRSKNIMEFWTDPDAPVIKQVLGISGTEEFNEAFNVFSVDDTTMTNGDRGSRLIAMFRDKSEFPQREQLRAREMVFEAETERKIEIMAVEAPYIRNFEFDAVLVSNPKTEDTKQSEQAMQLEKNRVYMSFFPEKMNTDELAVQTALKFGDDPRKVLKQNTFAPAVDQGAAQAEFDQGEGGRPRNNIANNTARGMRSGENVIPNNIVG